MMDVHEQRVTKKKTKLKMESFDLVKVCWPATLYYLPNLNIYQFLGFLESYL